MKYHNNIRGCLQLDYITNKGKEKTKYFRDILYLERFIRNSDIFVCDVYYYDLHEYIFECNLYVKFLYLISCYFKRSWFNDWFVMVINGNYF